MTELVLHLDPAGSKASSLSLEHRVYMCECRDGEVRSFLKSTPKGIVDVKKKFK